MKKYHKKHSSKYQEERKEYFKRYRLNNKKKMKEYQKQYRLKNKDKIKETIKKWELNNPDSTKARQLRYVLSGKKREYENKKRYTNMNFRIKTILYRRINHALKDNYKSKRTMELIGCSTDYLLNYLESQFDDEMSWSNYGAWHLDHIFPCCSFDLSNEEEQRVCFHYSNLQPLWAIDNLMKGGRV